MGLPEMTGSPNLIVVPDPAPSACCRGHRGWAGYCATNISQAECRFISRRGNCCADRSTDWRDRGFGLVVGLEIEWYLLRAAEALSDEHIGAPGMRGRPVKTAPVEPGYVLHGETNMDAMQPVLSALVADFDKIGLPLRSIENEFGPGQVECTFAARPALEAADHALLFRTATRQICRRMGHVATFMCRPALKGYYSSGWHLHQSVVERGSGQNMFMPESEREHLSPLGTAFLGGLLQHAAACTAFSTPTINGYRRFRPNSLAPDRATWCYDHRGVMVRVLGGARRPRDPAGESGGGAGGQSLSLHLSADRRRPRRDGARSSIRARRTRSLMPPTARACRRACPTRWMRSSASEVFRNQLGEVFIDYFLKLKRNETGRFAHGSRSTACRRPASPRSGSRANISIFSRPLD